ncbi:hypothetical protein EDB81DRAFT_808469 [Dactylonectria macrodidyma]|uniref:WSC domain-containing protein n=1 Tax=Dactylonectria macrodidyma TaxID=307937 RepID=A0A9P9E1I1_9HYPO|nr:hypothetical protein EDB81DRAFT_808469 [Dactylonectria macrodidyma]
MTKLTTVYSTLLLWVTLAAARSREPSQPPASVAIPGLVTSQGCYGSLPAVALGEPMVYLSIGSCSNRCMQRYKSVTILHLDICFCADTYPPRHSLLDDSKCNVPCPGYPFDACGGRKPDAYSVFNTGLNPDVEHDNDDNDESSPSPTDTANDHQLYSGQCHSVLTSINDAAESIFSAAKDFANKVQIFIGDTLGHIESDDTNYSGLEEGMSQEAEDLKI